MKYGSVSSGIECATVAWHPLGWKPVFFSEINPHACKLLRTVHPNVPNLGDMTKIFENETFQQSDFDVLVGGTPCQSFSIAGLREGLDSPNGNLAFIFCRILCTKQPTWFVWENVPGVFSSFTSGSGKVSHPRKVRYRRWKARHLTETSDFAAILNAFQECGYSVAWRVLDAQHFGVPQRRRRVFVVGHLGDDWRPPAAVLFERESLRRDFTPRREKGQETAGTLDARTKGAGFPGTDGATQGHIVAALTKSGVGVSGADDNQAQAGHLITATIDASYGRLQGASCQDLNHGHSTLVTQELKVFGGNNCMGSIPVPPPLLAKKGTRLDFESESFVVYNINQITSPQNGSNPKPGDVSPTLPKNNHPHLIIGNLVENNESEDKSNIGVFMGGQGTTAKGIAYSEDSSPTLRSSKSGSNMVPTLHQNLIVRRLTPLECERLQGLPDGYTDVAALSDSARYSLIGNGMAVPVMRWIGQRIELVQETLNNLSKNTI